MYKCAISVYSTSTIMGRELRKEREGRRGSEKGREKEKDRKMREEFIEFLRAIYTTIT